MALLVVSNRRGQYRDYEMIASPPLLRLLRGLLIFQLLLLLMVMLKGHRLLKVNLW